MKEEACNCGSTAAADVDFHVWLSATPRPRPSMTAAELRPLKRRSLVVEVTPRVRRYSSSWTVRALNDIARAKLPVRISGWLLLDQEHQAEIGKTRAALWEIHPIMQIDVFRDGRWETL